MKKLISIAIILVTVLALMAPAFASVNVNEYIGKEMWVNCSNGKTLNLREEPSANARIITRLECGTKVQVDYNAGSGWVAVSSYNWSGYVQSKFLVASKPGKFEITERDDNFVKVASPYTVTAKALNNKSDRSVGLRVTPNKTARAIRRLSAGDQLQVVAKGKVWSKVIDLQTGKTGYVANDYISRV